MKAGRDKNTMNMFYRIIFFMIFFNISSIMIASTGFFGPNVLYGDVTYAQIDGTSTPDSTKLRDPESMFNHLIFGSKITINLNLGVFNVNIIDYDINWAWILGTLIVASCIIAAAIGSLTPLAIGIVTSMFVLMYNNSKTLFDRILTNLDSTVGYVGLMIGIGILLVILLTIMDIATGHQNARG